MTSKLFSAGLLVLLPAIAAGSSLNAVARPFVGEDLVATFTRMRILLNGTENLCPTFISHTNFTETGNANTFLIEHSMIEHDNMACEGEAVTQIGAASDILARSEVTEVLDDSGLGPLGAVVADSLQGTGSLAGIDFNARTCGSGVGLPERSVYLFINNDEDVDLIPGVLFLPEGQRYLAVLANPDVNTSIGCVYQAPHIADITPSDEVVNAEPSSDPEVSTEPVSSGPACFPSDATVTLASGISKPVSAVKIGDIVRVGLDRFSTVFGFTHRDESIRTEFVHLLAGDAIVELSAGHYLYVNGGSLVAAGSVRKGDAVELASGEMAIVETISVVTKTGLYNPQTVDGDIVVNGVRASTYTTAVAPALAHAALAPFRALFTHLGIAPLSLPLGADRVADMLPVGTAIVA